MDTNDASNPWVAPALRILPDCEAAILHEQQSGNVERADMQNAMDYVIGEKARVREKLDELETRKQGYIAAFRKYDDAEEELVCAIRPVVWYCITIHLLTDTYQTTLKTRKDGEVAQK